MSPVHFLFLLSRQNVANPPRITSRACEMQEESSTSRKTGSQLTWLLGRFVSSERIERERSMERKKRRLVGKFWGGRKSDQDLESGLVFLMSKEWEAICVIRAKLVAIFLKKPLG
jgi:hypothetical protein